MVEHSGEFEAVFEAVEEEDAFAPSFGFCDVEIKEFVYGPFWDGVVVVGGEVAVRDELVDAAIFYYAVEAKFYSVDSVGSGGHSEDEFWLNDVVEMGH